MSQVRQVALQEKGGILACLDENCGFEKKAERKKKSTKTQEDD